VKEVDMGQILGLGLTHSPPLLAAAGDTASRIKRMMNDPLLPERYRSPATWPEPMRQQWGNDEGKTHAQQHRAELVECMQRSRKQLDDFNPDLVIVFGDDQYENFREDGVPAFQINCFDAFEARPWEHARPGPNAWNEAQDTVFHYKANPEPPSTSSHGSSRKASRSPMRMSPATRRCRTPSSTRCSSWTGTAAASTTRSSRS
jgi:hypothetical protein